jgi:hypothetical protein
MASCAIRCSATPISILVAETPLRTHTGNDLMKLSLSILVAFAQVAHANPTDGHAAAEQLFTEARALVAKGDFATACPKFEASLRLDPALGTRLNLADCYERIGKWTSAWAAYKAAADVARGAKDDREQVAVDRAKALEARLPRLVIKVTEQPPGLVVTRGGAIVEPALFGSAVFVDPGPTRIVARAPGRVDRSIEVVALEGKTVDVEVTLDRLRTVTVTSDPGRSRRRLGLGLAGAGGAAALVGLGFGIAARSAWKGAYDSGECIAEPESCSPAGQLRVETARSRANIANLTVGAGLGLLAAGAIVYFTAPSRRVLERSAVVPVIGRDGVGVGWVTSF